MKSFNTANLGIQQGSRTLFSDFVNDGPMWLGKGNRSVYSTIEFAEPFGQIPVVHATIGMWDMDHEHNIRADLSVTQITAKGFTVKFSTWADSRVARVRVDWMAIGGITNDDHWDIS